MNVFLTDRELTYSDQAPVLVAGSSEGALAKARRTIEATGLRVADQVGIDVAPDRIERQVAAMAVWIELDRDCGEPMDLLLDHINQDVAAGRYSAVVSAPARLLDPLAARLTERSVELIIDADDAERASALAIAAAHRWARSSFPTWRRTRMPPGCAS